MTEAVPLLIADGVSRSYGRHIGCCDVSLTLWEGEVLAVVGESGSGKSTLLNCLSGRLSPDAGRISYRRRGEAAPTDIARLRPVEIRDLSRSEWGFIHQDPREGLRMAISGGGNIGERLMAVGNRNYAEIRSAAETWMGRVDLALDRIDDRPTGYSGGMRQRLQIARNLVSAPRLVFMDEPTGGLDVSVQARLVDLIRRLVDDLSLSVILVTHDLAVARHLSERIMVMRSGEVLEAGLTDRVLDDPQAPYTQLLVESILL
ncbi:MAG: phosphonate C-P lyase system protein PhnK [Pseudomonadota bacterium]